MTARQTLAAIAVLGWCALLWWFIQWRTAPPPPPASLPGQVETSIERNATAK